MINSVKDARSFLHEMDNELSTAYLNLQLLSESAVFTGDARQEKALLASLKKSLIKIENTVEKYRALKNGIESST